MQFSFKNTIAFICLFSFFSYGQDMGKRTLKVGASVPTGLLANLVKTGKGGSFLINSNYVYQVRSRFSIEFYQYTPNDSAFHTYSDYSGVYPVDLLYTKFNSLDIGFGLDYNPFQQRIPELYFGPQLFIGSDRTAYSVNDFTNISSNQRRFIHAGFKVHVGYEKMFGNITLFSEYSFGKHVSENYNIQNTDKIFTTTNLHQIGLGFRF